MDSALAKQLVQQEGANLGAASRPPLPPSTRHVGDVAAQPLVPSLLGVDGEHLGSIGKARERQEAEDRAMALNLQRQLSGLQ